MREATDRIRAAEARLAAALLDEARAERAYGDARAATDRARDALNEARSSVVADLSAPDVRAQLFAAPDGGSGAVPEGGHHGSEGIERG